MSKHSQNVKNAYLGALNLYSQAQMTWVKYPAFGLGSQLRLGPFRLFPVSEDLDSLVESWLQGIYKEMLFP